MEPTLAISALQHYAYCPRQFALIHIEQVWSDNYFTAQGNVLHERVDSQEAETRGKKRFERSVAVNSQQLGLRGKLDLLEVLTDSTGNKTYLPVEYKRGKNKVHDWDRIQLCAQALCLEDMLAVNIAQGALWYWQERKRQSVDFDTTLRQTTFTCIEAAKKLLESGNTPEPTADKKRCRACSLQDVCVPHAVRRDGSTAYAQSVFEVLPYEEAD